MQNRYPPERVLIAQSIPSKFAVSPYAPYVDIFTEEERSIIVEKYRTPNLFDGQCIRLDVLSDGMCSFSSVTFYDFLCCNIVGFHNRDPLAWTKMSQVLKKYGKLDTVEKVLAVRELPNLLCTSLLLHDINNEYFLIERNTKVSVGSGLFACTSSGSLALEDLSSPNPIVACAQRELIEELNLSCTLYVQGVIMPIQKMQPVALLTGFVNRAWREILPGMKCAADFEKENSRVLLVPKEYLLPLISMYKFTDAAAYRIFFEAGGDKYSWKQVSGQFININNFYS